MKSLLSKRLVSLWEKRSVRNRLKRTREHILGRSGFFDLPDSENVSAVIFSNAGTIAKFDRMGVTAGFGADGYSYFRVGFRYNPDPNAVMGEAFRVDVREESYEEYWTQEIQVFHNPNAKHPLPFEALLGATHHRFENGHLESLTPTGAVLSSFTLLLEHVGDDQGVQS